MAPVLKKFEKLLVRFGSFRKIQDRRLEYLLLKDRLTYNDLANEAADLQGLLKKQFGRLSSLRRKYRKSEKLTRNQSSAFTVAALQISCIAEGFLILLGRAGTAGIVTVDETTAKLIARVGPIILTDDQKKQLAKRTARLHRLLLEAEYKLQAIPPYYDEYAAGQIQKARLKIMQAMKYIPTS